MLIVISSATPEEVKKALDYADENSNAHTGSHDDYVVEVGINSVARPIRHSVFESTSMSSHSRSENSVDPGPLPSIELIFSAYVFESSGHYGGSNRFRSLLKFFVRSAKASFRKSDCDFLVFDLAEVGTLGGGNFHARDIFAAIWQAQKKVTVEVGEVATGAGGNQEYSAPNPAELAGAIKRFASFCEGFRAFANRHLSFVAKEDMQLRSPGDIFHRNKEEETLRELCRATDLGVLLDRFCHHDWPVYTATPPDQQQG